MSRTWQLGALMRKNYILMKRSICASLCEILFPITLMLLLVLVRKSIEIQTYPEPTDGLNFLNTNSSAYIDPSSMLSAKTWNGLTIRRSLDICAMRPTIAAIGSDPEVALISNKIAKLWNFPYPLNFKNFSDVNETNFYVKNVEYSESSDFPEICFGFYFKKIDDKIFNYSLHYFDAVLQGSNQDTPNTLIPSLDPFQVGPDTSSYSIWLKSGYLEIMKIINDVILQSVTGELGASVNFGMMAEKYSQFQKDPFGLFLQFLLPFFLIIAYLCPLCVLVFRMVQEKESKAKEGMKIMGMNEMVYFLSFFLQWLILNTIYAIINSVILTLVLTKIQFIFIFSFFWLYGMSVFALAYLFQAVMDKTRIAMIITVLVYFLMFFVSQGVLSDDVQNITKMFISLLPPTCLQLGIAVIAKFQANFVDFDFSEATTNFGNYSVADMYIMLTVDFFLYLFLGYYLQNVVTQQYGIRRPYYFLCTSSFWCKTKKKNQKIRSLQKHSDPKNEKLLFEERDGENEISLDKNYFQSEQFYEEKIKTGDYMQIKNLKKVFDDGKVAVNGLNLNLYKEEIFALLGHNGAGKSTTISILCGLYEATGGTALYNGQNIFDYENMGEFRKKLGICPQHDVLFNTLSVREHLEMFCVFKGVENHLIQNEIDKVLEDMQLSEKANELAKNLSGGQKRKLSIAIALIGGSEIVFLDEPSSGMDITSRRNLWEILKKCVGNRIIVLTTHYMEEAAVLGNRIGIVSSGKLKCCGNSLFLIDKFGKYLSVNISKLPEASDENIINFFRENISDEIEYEVLTEEILFRIPKKELENTGNKITNNDIEISEKENSSFSLKRFFNELDQNLERLKIKSYSASMPTLEDVFLNVSSENKNNMVKSSVRESRFSIHEDKNFEFDRKDEIKSFSKYIVDFKCSVKKRFLQIIRDKKTFLLEIFCPIILVFIGIAICQIQFIKDSPSIDVGINLLPSGQKIIINSNLYDNKNQSVRFEKDTINNVTFEYRDLPHFENDSLVNSYISFNDMIFQNFSKSSYGNYYIINFDIEKKVFEWLTIVDIQSRNSPIIYTHYMMQRILNLVSRDIKINFSHEPFPIINKVKTQGQARNTSNLVFFISVAFALIPANFITILIKERESNTKHLQIISGMSLISYWLSNYFFELVKYYFLGGLSLFIIYLYGIFPYWLWLLYLLYGLAMTSFTYMLTLFFSTESTAQNSVILINFLFGTLGGSVILVLRIFGSLSETAKMIAYFFRVIPSFAFSYGFNQLLSAQILFIIDHPDDFYKMVLDVDKYIIGWEYVGTDVAFLAAEFFIYMLVIIIFESWRNISCYKRAKKESSVLDNTKQITNGIDDSLVLSEMEKANSDKNDKNDKYSIKVKNLTKVYSKGLCGGEKFKAVNNISFCLEFGECFALLGVNGAGKTTTFKSLTSEHLPTSGEIFINGLEVNENFNQVRNLIGYCPQFDAIFDFMTVYENLDFYANLKGIPSGKTHNIVMALMKELNLLEYKNKISGNLSGGNKRKLSVGIAMIGNPPIVLLDEPSTGMDPEARRFMWAVIHKISTRSKLSSVILTTHSMEEAETLCRRMGIMVAGQFKCLGSSQRIKDKYGYGYEVDLRIQNIPEEVLEKMRNMSEMKLDTYMKDLNGVEEVLIKIEKGKYMTQVNQTGLGRQIVEEIYQRGKISLRVLLEWVFYTDNILLCISKLLHLYPDVFIVEFWASNFKIKILKNENQNSIGFLFGLFEDQKKDCFLSEYSISQTSLEQIFNKFANEINPISSQQKLDKEIKIDSELLSSLS